MPSSRFGARLLILAAALVLLMAPSAATAGTVFHLIFVNNTAQDLTIGPITRENDWYSSGLAGTVLPANSSKIVDTEMCSAFFGCPGISYIEFPIVTADPGGPTSATFYLKGVRGSFPGWVTSLQQEFAGAGGISVIRNTDVDLGTIIYDFSCQSAVVNNTITCTITFGDALFSTTNPKYGTTDPVLNARSYYVNGALMVDAVVFNQVAMRRNLITRAPGGGLIYASASAAGLEVKMPTCPNNGVPSILYVVDRFYFMYVMPVCDDRHVAVLPVIYSAKGRSGIIEPVDITLTFDQNLVGGQIPITHGGLSGAQRVRAAGELTILNGVVQTINNSSGHYGVPTAPFLDAMRFFRLGAYLGAFQTTNCDQPSGVCTLTAH